MDASLKRQPDEWPVDKAGLTFMPNISVRFGVQYVLLIGHYSLPGAILSLGQCQSFCWQIHKDTVQMAVTITSRVLSF